jgi:hypothetical protein
MTEDDIGRDPAEQRHTVLNVFGLTLEVSNPRLAELLTMDAREALTSDVRDLLGGSPNEDDSGDDLGVSEEVVPVPDAREAREERQRKEFRERARDAGGQLGFDVRQDGSWVSPTGIVVLARDLPGSVTLAAAAHFVKHLEEVAARASQPERTSVLFVVKDRDAADVVRVAIRQARAHSLMRVATLDDIEELARLVANGVAAHEHALAIIAPIAAVDVGEVLAVLRVARAAREADQRDA